MLVSKIFPDREEYEEQQEKVLAILSKNHSQQLMSTIGEAIKAQAAHVKMINRKKNLSDYDELMASHCQVGSDPHEPREGEEDTVPYRPKKKRKTGEAGAEGPGGLQAGEVEIIFKTHACLAPDLTSRLGEQGTRFIKTKVEASIDHLCQYLGQRLGLDLGLLPEAGLLPESKAEEVTGLKIYVYQTPGPGTELIELTGPETLEMVLEDYWKVAKPMELFFEFVVTEVVGKEKET
jgi:hypothetical protein